MEARLVEWASVLERLPDREAGWIYNAHRSWWPEVPKDPQQEFVNAVQRGGQWESAPPPRVPASRQEITRFEEASEWLGWIRNARDRKIVAWVAMWLTRPYENINWRWVRDRTGIYLHRDHLRRCYKRAVQDIVARLNADRF